MYADPTIHTWALLECREGMSHYLYTTTSHLSCISQWTCCCRAWWEDRTISRLPDKTREQVCVAPLYCYFVILKQEHLWEHVTQCQWRLLIFLDIIPCGSVVRGNVSEEYTATLSVTVTEGGKWPILRTQGEDGIWGILFSLPSERLLGRVSVCAEMQSRWWPAAEVAYAYHTLCTQIKLGRWQKGSVYNHQLFHIYLPNNYVICQLAVGE
jgi:hypothetical protein